jgi:hypothetical protein
MARLAVLSADNLIIKQCTNLIQTLTRGLIAGRVEQAIAAIGEVPAASDTHMTRTLGTTERVGSHANYRSRPLYWQWQDKPYSRPVQQ